MQREILINIGRSCMDCEQFVEAEKYFSDALKNFEGNPVDRMQIVKDLYNSMVGGGYGVFLV